jgi:RimJ/RimL family protein N-acetyltransferase
LPDTAGCLPAEVRTQRLVLRRWQESDLVPFAALNADPAVMEHFPSTLNRAESDAMVARIEAAFEARGYGLWAVCLQQDPGREEFLGFTGLTNPKFRPEWNEPPLESPPVEVGWRFKRSAWGHGYAIEAARAAVGFGFAALGLREILSFTTVGNLRSQAVMKRLGMRFGELYDHPIPGSAPLPSVLYRLARAGWQPS